MAKPILREGSKGRAVRDLQMLLNAHLTGGAPLIVDGDFGNATELAVKKFQAMKGLQADGVVGQRTWDALEGHPQTTRLYIYRPGPQEPLADIARPYIGATEATGNRMGTDPRMREIFEADRLTSKGGKTDGYPWCCAFVSMCVQRLIAQSAFFRHVVPPVTAGVTTFRTRSARSQNCLIFTPSDRAHNPHVGDIVVYTFSHIGIVASVDAGQITAIEGNTTRPAAGRHNCREKDRLFGIIRCFIRLPYPAGL